jgi:signal peptidase I
MLYTKQTVKENSQKRLITMLKQEKILYELGEEYIKEKGKLWLRVISPSMEPLIQIGNKILVESVNHGMIQIGDIILFKRNTVNGAGLERSPFITHRVIGKRRKHGTVYFLEKGDRSVIGTWIPETCIIARAVAIKRNDNCIVSLNNYQTRILNKLFTLSLVMNYIFEKIIGMLRNWAKKYRALGVFRELYRYTYKIITRGQNLSKNLLVYWIIRE